MAAQIIRLDDVRRARRRSERERQAKQEMRRDG